MIVPRTVLAQCLSQLQGGKMEQKLIDWHPADIIAALRKKGTSMAAESRRNGLSSSTLANVLTRPWPKGEMIIARAIETDPWVIWPSRYHNPITHEFIDRSKLIRKRERKQSKA
jgi:Ner family transcriptional regulator